jgi:hypothetical protein
VLCKILVAGMLNAQKLPQSATPRGVIFTFLNETATPVDSIDRLAFAERLKGEFARTDPRSFRGMLPAGARISIDSIPDLARDRDGEPRVVAFATVTDVAEKSNLYIFASRDSIWRIEAMRQFPTARQRSQIAHSLGEIDTQTVTGRYLHSDLQRLLLSDDNLATLLLPSIPDARLLLDMLLRGKQWREFALRDVDFSHVDEYRELDDDIDRNEFIFYRLDRSALERLKQQAGVRKIQRDSRYPGAIFFVCATVQGDSYGYIYCPLPEWLPQVSSSEFIMVKPIAESWWLYKKVKEQ